MGIWTIIVRIWFGFDEFSVKDFFVFLSAVLSVRGIIHYHRSDLTEGISLVLQI
jgi:hypothetical protein